MALAIDADERDAVSDGVAEIRAYLAHRRHPGLHSYVTGPGGIAADLEHVADEAAKTLLIATLGLVLVLLLVVYRAPVLALLPLLAVGTAYLVAVGIAYLLIEAGAIVVNAEGTFLLLVLVFGAGTDYSLLLIHRYREELGRGVAPGTALPRALAESVRPIAASAGTVIAAMLVLLLADLESTHWLGPVLAIGIAVMLAAALTLLPAVLSLLGGRAFWPGAGAEPRERDRRWARIAGSRAAPPAGDRRDRLGGARRPLARQPRRPRHARLRPGGNALDRIRPRHRSPRRTLPAGAGVAADRGRRNRRGGGRRSTGLEELGAVKLAVPVPPSEISTEAAIAIVLRGNPYSAEAADLVEGIRERLQEVAPSALVGGIPAENYDVEQTNSRDTKTIVPAVLLVVGLILALVLRALAAPAYLIVTVVASFAATLGLVTFAFTEILGVERDGLRPGAALLHLPGRPRRRLQHLPDDPCPRGGGDAGDPRRRSWPRWRTPAA